MQKSLFEKEIKLQKLSKMGDMLEQLKSSVDWNSFVPILDRAIPRIVNPKGGRPPFNNLMMFKVLLIKRIYGLSYEQTEYQINDRLSFMRFLDFDFENTVPDANTIWVYEEKLAKNSAGRELFENFFKALNDAGYILREGSIVDASFVTAPGRKNTKEQREVLKKGGIPLEWIDAKHPQMLMQRDIDATWTKKGNKSYFGYKDTVKADLNSKFITDFRVDTASVNDAVAAEGIFTNEDKVAYGDSIYPPLKLPEGVENLISEKAQRGHPLTEEQRSNNHLKAKKRCRVEHVFASIDKVAGRQFVRCKNIIRAEFEISLMNLIYNIRRRISIENPTTNWVKRKIRELAKG